MRNIPDKFVEKIKTHILCSIIHPPAPQIMELLCHNVEKYGRGIQATDDNIIRSTRVAFRITKATNTHSDDVLLHPFVRQKLLCEGGSVLVLYVSTLQVLFANSHVLILYCRTRSSSLSVRTTASCCLEFSGAAVHGGNSI